MLMKPVIFSFLILSQLYCDTYDSNTSRSCYEMLREIGSLKEEQRINRYSKVATFLFGGYLYEKRPEEKEVDVKIRVLKLELSTCI